METFDVEELMLKLDTSRHDFAEFFRGETLSLMVACWPADAQDEQTPHTEDEVYYVVAGRAKLRVGSEEGEVGPGTVAYIASGVEHRFHSIQEDLHVLVFWSPPRHSRLGADTTQDDRN